MRQFPDNIQDLEDREVLRQLADAHRHLGELKGSTGSIPNIDLLLSTVPLREARESSAIENIVTTQDAFYRARLHPRTADTPTKEVDNYVGAIHYGRKSIKHFGGLSINTIVELQKIIEPKRPGFRRIPGTEIKNKESGEVVYTPPPPNEIFGLMSELEKFIDQQDSQQPDPLVKMALIHHRFESIHPFYDGNGRTGRIINILYLMQAGLLDEPILYLSRYINQNRGDYYRLLRSVQHQGNWKEWVLYLVRGVAETARETTAMVKKIKYLLRYEKARIREQHNFYSQDLLNHLFSMPYTKISRLMKELNISRPTATHYLEELTAGGMLSKRRLGRQNYYVYRALVELLIDGDEQPAPTPTTVTN